MGCHTWLAKFWIFHSKIMLLIVFKSHIFQVVVIGKVDDIVLIALSTFTILSMFVNFTMLVTSPSTRLLSGSKVVSFI